MNASRACRKLYALQTETWPTRLHLNTIYYGENTKNSFLQTPSRSQATATWWYLELRKLGLTRKGNLISHSHIFLVCIMSQRLSKYFFLISSHSLSPQTFRSMLLSVRNTLGASSLTLKTSQTSRVSTKRMVKVKMPKPVDKNPKRSKQNLIFSFGKRQNIFLPEETSPRLT